MVEVDKGRTEAMEAKSEKNIACAGVDGIVQATAGTARGRGGRTARAISGREGYRT